MTGILGSADGKPAAKRDKGRRVMELSPLPTTKKKESACKLMLVHKGEKQKQKTCQ